MDLRPPNGTGWEELGLPKISEIIEVMTAASGMYMYFLSGLSYKFLIVLS